MKKAIRWSGATRATRVAAVILGFALTAATSAFAAWVIFGGVTGTGGGKVGSSTISPALTLTPYTGAIAAVSPGTTGDVSVVGVNSASVPEKILTLSAGTITATPTCDTSALSFTVDPTRVGATATAFPLGSTSGVIVGHLTAAANLDPACANASLSIAFTGTTSP